MTEIDGTCLDVLNATEFVAIVTQGGDGPHLVGNWGEYIRRLGVRGNTIVMPAGRYHKTEENLRSDNRLILLVASRQVQGSHSPGQGCEISGTGMIVTEGPLADEVKSHFSWARGAFVIQVDNWKTQL